MFKHVEEDCTLKRQRKQRQGAMWANGSSRFNGKNKKQKVPITLSELGVPGVLCAPVLHHCSCLP